MINFKKIMRRILIFFYSIGPEEKSNGFLLLSLAIIFMCMIISMVCLGIKYSKTEKIEPVMSEIIYYQK